jgi:hypothetical protein
MPNLIHTLRRPARWLRRTRRMARATLADLGLADLGLADLGLTGAAAHGPAWLRDNPFLLKASRAETRRLGLFGRLLVSLLILSGLLLGGLWLDRTHSRQVTLVLGFLFGTTFPAALFIVLTFVHATLVSSARTALTVSLADEARRGTLADLLLTPQRRAEMLLAMAVGPARTAFLIALAGLPLYVLLGEIGALSARDIVFLYLLFALVSFAPPVYAIPALAGGAMTPDTALGRAGMSRARPPARPNAYAGVGVYVLFSVFFVGQTLGVLRGGWLGHLLAALHLHLSPGFSFFLFFAWPFYAVQLLGGRLDFFHAPLSPLLFLLPLMVCHWAASALHSAAALSAGDEREMTQTPLASRARTLSRWTARAAGLCALGVVWKAWVESGDTATLAGGTFGAAGWDAAGLLLLLGGLSLPNVCGRALATEERRKDTGALRPPLLVLRRAFRRAARPLGVAGVTFLAACALGGLSPLAPPVSQVAGKIALAGASSVLWAVGVRRLVPVPSRLAGNALLYVLPAAALSAPVPGAALLSALSPATAWLRLFPDAPGLLSRLPWHVAAPPSWEVCLAGPALAGALLIAGWKENRARAASPEGPGDADGPPFPGREPPGRGTRGRGMKDAPIRHASRTAALLAWITARTDNPLFTYELRTRTRAGRWADWLLFAPLALAAAAVLALAYPEVVSALSDVSPFHFFADDPRRTGRVGPLDVWPDLAALLLAAQCYALGFRGQVIGEGLIARDRQRGIWGFLLLTPLSARAILWGKVWGQAALPGAAWAVCGLSSLILYMLAAPTVGVLPALGAWLVGQTFVAALFVLGLGVGAALSTYPAVSKNLRGLATLLFTLAVGLGVWGQFKLLPFETSADGPPLAARLLLGIVYALVIAAAGLAFALWRVGDVRRRDVAVGDGVE